MKKESNRLTLVNQFQELQKAPTKISEKKSFNRLIIILNCRQIVGREARWNGQNLVLFTLIKIRL